MNWERIAWVWLAFVLFAISVFFVFSLVVGGIEIWNEAVR